MGTAFWLVPPAPETALLKWLMRVPPSLGDELLPYTLPSFEPHITIASFQASVPLESLHSALNDIRESHDKPLRVEFSALSAGDVFFRSVLLDVVPTPELYALRESVTYQLREYEARSPRYPHLSLFYVPDGHAEDRKRIRDGVWEVYGLHPRDNNVDGSQGDGTKRITINLPGEHGERCLEGFLAEEVWLVRCEGAVEDWVVLDKIRLVHDTDKPATN